jgi:ATP-dependent DNA helicase RecQ
MPARERHSAQERFAAGDVHVMVARNAFGMGIDIPDIRFVAHTMRRMRKRADADGA